MVCFLMGRRPPITPRTDPPVPYTTRFRSCLRAGEAAREAGVRGGGVARLRPVCHRRAMTRELTDTILRVVERAPDWIRRDLDSKDAVVRIRAEESLAAMIADALAQQADAEV